MHSPSHHLSSRALNFDGVREGNGNLSKTDIREGVSKGVYHCQWQNSQQLSIAITQTEHGGSRIVEGMRLRCLCLFEAS